MEVDCGEDEERPCSFWVTRVPQAVLSADPEESLRPEFEAVFRAYGEDVTFKYLRSFGRVNVTYPSFEQAELAQANLNHQEFQGTSLKMRPVKPFILGSQKLDLPQRTKQFLISPPASPPVGWEPSAEQTPCVDFALVTALASLQLPGAVQEVHKGSATIPSIVVVTPEDTEADLTPTVVREAERYQPAVRISSLPSTIVRTARPPLSESHHS